jgi:D-alanyl-D-alanine carboxypeptidase (penicillin-binding protein 5/6)
MALLMAHAAQAVEWPQSPTLQAKSWALIDARSGQVLSQHNATEHLPPASLTKMMTLYLIFEDLKLGRLSLDEKVNVSKKAWKIGGSTMFLDPRMHPTVDQVLHGIATLSGNDGCIAMAEHLAGSESAFVERMNRKAKELGLTNTHFADATGFPNENHYSCALDMARLGAALWRDFPDRYALFSEKNYTFDGRTQWNRNRLLWSMPGADGIKTGHTESAGYCLVGSAEQDNTRLVSAVFGAESDRARQQESKVLLMHGFRNFVTVRPAERDVRRQVEIFGGEKDHVWLRPQKAIWVTVPKGLENKLSFHLRYEAPLHAPVAKGQTVGQIDAVLGGRNGDNGDTIASIPMQTADAIGQASWFGRQWDNLRLWWQGSTAEASQKEE